MENIKVLEQYAHDFIDNNITFTPEADVFKGSDGHYYKVLTSDEVDEEIIMYSEELADSILQEVIRLCNNHGLHDFTSLITIDKDALKEEVDSIDLESILGVREVLDDEYGWIDDDGILRYFIICRVDE